MKNYCNGTNGSLDTTDDKNNKIKNRSREIIQTGIRRREKD